MDKWQEEFNKRIEDIEKRIAALEGQAQAQLDPEKIIKVINDYQRNKSIGDLNLNL